MSELNRDAFKMNMNLIFRLYGMDSAKWLNLCRKTSRRLSKFLRQWTRIIFMVHAPSKPREKRAIGILRLFLRITKWIYLSVCCVRKCLKQHLSAN